MVVPHFNPRSPHGERPSPISSGKSTTYFNPRSPHGERHGRMVVTGVRWAISIHAPRTGSDRIRPVLGKHPLISIHTPRTGSDQCVSTSPRGQPHFNPRSPHGERRRANRRCSTFRHFNPRSPHGERRGARDRKCVGEGFQSTLPARGATSCRCCFARAHRISIHAPRTGSDCDDAL